MSVILVSTELTRTYPIAGGCKKLPAIESRPDSREEDAKRPESYDTTDEPAPLDRMYSVYLTCGPYRYSQYETGAAYVTQVEKSSLRCTSLGRSLQWNR